MAGDSKAIVSNQNGVHDDLAKKVLRHLERPFQKPIAEHTQAVFDELDTQVKAWGGPIIFDACCGVGESTKQLAQANPHALVVGIDKSANRIGKGLQEAGQGQYLLARADLNDLWRLAYWAGWQVAEQYILYPNPWPKSEHLGRRWHGAPVFPYILALGGVITVRSNWHLYVEEFVEAMALAGIDAQLEPYPAAGVAPPEPMTPFERKYWNSGHTSMQVRANLADYQGPAWLKAR